MKTGEKIKKNFKDVIAYRTTKANDKTDNPITSKLNLNNMYAVKILIILMIFIILAPVIFLIFCIRFYYKL